MRILSRYILMEFLKSLLFTALVFVGLFIIAELVDDMRSFVAHRPALSYIILFYIYRTPYYLVQIFPLSILLSALFSLGQLGRNNELIAMRASGVSFYQIAWPILGMSLLIVGAIFIFNELVIPYTGPRAHYIQQVKIEKKNDESFQARRDWVTRSVSGNRILHTRYLDAVSGKMSEIILLTVLPDLTVLERLDAPQAFWADGAWTFQNGVIRRFDPKGQLVDHQAFQSHKVNFRELPQDFIRPKVSEDQLLSMPLKELREQIQILRETGTDPRMEEVNYHLKIAFPFANFILALLGVALPFVFPTGHRAIVWTAIGFVITLVTGFFYIGFIAVGTSFGKNGMLPPLLSVWIANITFGCLGVYLMSKAKS